MKKNVGAICDRQKNRGITLIALVITIIIMLILVAVTVNYSIKSGLLTKAKDGTTRYKDQELKERLQYAIVSKMNIDGEIPRDLGAIKNSEKEYGIEANYNNDGKVSITLRDKSNGENVVEYDIEKDLSIKVGETLKISKNIDKKETVTSSEERVIFKNTITAQDIKILTDNKEENFVINGIGATAEGEFISTGEVTGKAGKLTIVGDLQDATFEYILQDFMKGDETFYVSFTADEKDYIQKLTVEQGNVVEYEEDFPGLIIYLTDGSMEYVDIDCASDGRALHFVCGSTGIGYTFTCLTSKITFAYIGCPEPCATAWYYLENGEDIDLGEMLTFDNSAPGNFDYCESTPMQSALDGKSHLLEIQVTEFFTTFVIPNGHNAYLDKIIVYK